ncbi:hypothetical protein sync_0800 [Synechococcus sp. CC9311]|nr:hypothetical protein sync_0800 [Synechococcus sp. CC9311]
MIGITPLLDQLSATPSRGRIGLSLQGSTSLLGNGT